MSRIIFIDKLVRSSKGHNLEYCLRVAEPFEALGHQTIILANKKFSGPKPHNLRAEINFDWDRAVLGRSLLEQNKKLREKQRLRLRSALRDRWRASTVGKAYRVLYQWRSGDATGEVSATLRLMAAGLGLLAISWRILAAIVWLLMTPVRFVWRRFSWFSRLMAAPAATWFGVRWGVVVGRLGLGEVKVIIRRLAAFDSIKDPQFSAVSSSIAGSLRNLKVGREDIIICTTVVERDLDIFRNAAIRGSAKDATWHFIFREPIFLIEGTGYIVEQAQRRLRTRLIAMQAAKIATAWWCDTDELADQYSYLGPFQFGVLPIPLPDQICTFAKDEMPKAQTPLCIGYLGDARPEKGYQLLPQIMQEVSAQRSHWLASIVSEADEAIESEELEAAEMPVRNPHDALQMRRHALLRRVDRTRTKRALATIQDGGPRFSMLAQSNFNVPDGTSGTRAARYRLLSQDDLGVVVTPAPKDSATYLDNLRRSDLLLLYYDHPLYHAGSSGVFAEAVMAGRPVVVNDSSWGGRRLRSSPQFVSHIRWLADRYAVTKEGDQGDLLNAWSIWWLVASAVTHVAIVVDFRQRAVADQMAFTIEFADGDGKMSTRRRLLSARISAAAAVVRIPPTATMYRTRLDRLNPSLTPDDIDISISLLSMPPGEPDCAVGQVCNTEEIADSVREIGRHYRHYRATASEFSAEWALENRTNLIAGRILNATERLAHAAQG